MEINRKYFFGTWNFYCSEDVWIKFVSPTLCLHSSVWWAFIRRGWKEAASVHPRCLAHPCYYGLLPSRGKHSSGQLAYRSVQVCGCLHANSPFTSAVKVLFLFVFKNPTATRSLRSSPSPTKCGNSRDTSWSWRSTTGPSSLPLSSSWATSTSSATGCSEDVPRGNKTESWMRRTGGSVSHLWSPVAFTDMKTSTLSPPPKENKTENPNSYPILC